MSIYKILRKYTERPFRQKQIHSPTGTCAWSNQSLCSNLFIWNSMLRWSTVIYTHLWWSCFFGHQTQAAKLERNSCLTKHSHSFDNSAIILLHSTMHGELFPTKAVPTRENWVKLKFLSELGRVTDRVHYVSLRLHARSFYKRTQSRNHSRFI